MPPLDYIVIVLVCIILICMFYFLTTDKYGNKPKAYSRGYVILFILLSFIPYFNFFLAIVLLAIYIMARVYGDLLLKRNKFTKKWFGVGNKD